MDGLTYRRNGETLIPNLILREQPTKPIGKYGLMRRNHIRKHRPILYNSLLLQEKLYPHLLEIDRAANKRLKQLMAELEASNPPPRKALNQPGWAAHMNNLKAKAEEIIKTELIYS